MWSDTLLHLLNPFFVFVLHLCLISVFLYCLLYWPFSFCLNLGQWWWLVVCVRLMVCKVRVENAKHWVTSCLCMKPNDALRTACNLQ